jgi:hypothetical protein
MATVTPNFNWPVPTSTDLVKDGATAIEALGDSIDASLVDLKGGTTGQVLSKTTGTDMDFTWVTTDDANAIQNSIVDAKGDLISATANDTPARLAVGANNTILTADSSTATGLKWAAPAIATARGCSLYLTADQSIANSTGTYISWNIELYDTDSFHDNSTNPTRITIPTGLSGKYLISTTLPFDNNATGVRVGYIHVNGTLIYLTAQGNLSATVDTYLDYTYVANLTAGDYIQIQSFQDSGGALNVIGSVTYYANVQVTYLGA